jgi:hypothetical protein
MTQYVINIGALPNDGTGDPLRTAFNEVNLNFDQVFAAGPVLSNIQIANNTILVTNTNGNLVLATNGVGKIQAAADVVPSVNLARNLGSSTQKWNTIYSQYVTVSGDATVAGNLTVQGNIIQVGNIVTESLTIQLANAAGSANAADGSGITVGANDDIATLLYSAADDVWTTNIGISSIGNVIAPYFIGDGSQLTNIAVGNNGAVQINWLGSFSNQGGTPGDTYSTLQFDSNGMPTLDGTTAYQQRVDYSPYLQVLAPRVESTDFGIVAGPAIQITGYADDVFYNTPRSAYLSVQDQANVTQQWDFGILGNGSNNFSVQNRTANTIPLAIGTDGSVSVSTLISPEITVNTIKSDDSTLVKIQDGLEVDGDTLINGNITASYFFGNGSQLTGISGGGANTGNVTFDNINIIGTGNLHLQPDPANAGSYLDIYLTGGPDIHIASNDNSIVIGRDTGANVFVGNDGEVSIRTDNGVTPQVWNFDNTGNLTVPGGMLINGNINTLGTQTALLQSTNDLPLSFIASGANGSVTSFWAEDFANLMTSNIAAIYTPLQNTQTVRIVTGSNGGNIAIYDFDKDGMFTAGAVCATGNVYASNVSASGNVTGAYVLGNGSGLTNLPAPAVTQDITSNGAMSIMTYDGNIKYVNYATVEPSSGNIAGGNITTTGLISATGNITSGNISTGRITLTNGAVIRDTTGDAVAFGQNAGATGQGQVAIAIGNSAGNVNQGNISVAIGYQAGNTSQGDQSVAIGDSAGKTTQGESSVAVGQGAGQTTQGGSAIAIGFGAGATTQGTSAIAFGRLAGQTTQGIYGVAIGFEAGQTTQGNSAVAIGENAGYNTQGISAVAIGDGAGRDTQGQYAVAIGYGAGNSNQANNSIIINATGSVLEQTTANTFTVKPVRQANTANAMYYDASTGEITYDTAGGGANTGNVTFNDVNIIGDGNLRLQPDPANAGSYLDIYLTTGPDIHIAKTDSNVILGSDTGANVTVGTNGNVDIQTWNGTANTWTFDTTGNLTTSSNLVIGPGPGGGSSVLQYDAALQILGEGANSVVQLGWTANQSAPDSVTTIAMNYPGGGEGNVLIAVGNNATTVNYWLFDNTGNLTLPGNSFAVNYANGTAVSIGGGSGNTGNVTFADVTIQGVNGLNLSAGADFTANLAYLQVRSGDQPSHIHLDTGNNFAYDLLVGDDDKFVQVGLGGNISIAAYDNGNSAQYIWNFDPTGNLTLPAGGVVRETNIPDGALSGSAIALKPVGGTTANQQLLIYPTANDGDHIHLTSGNLYSTELYFGSDNFYVKLANTGNIVINSNDGNSSNAMWTFGANGFLSLPGEGVLRSTDDTVTLQSFNTTTGNANSVYMGTSGGLGFSDQEIGGNWLEIFRSGTEPQIGTTVGNLLIQTSSNSTPYIWNFGSTGNLTLPGNVSTTGNITAGYLFGNGSQLTGLPATYGNADVATFLAAYGSNTISTTGNITSGNVLTGGLITATGNVQAGNVLTAGLISATGNVTGGNLVTSGSGGAITMTGGNISGANVITANVFSATGNIVTANSFVGNLVGTTVSVTGNVSAGNVSVTGNVYATNIVAEAPFSIQAADFNASTGNRYGVNTTGGAVAATLPASPATGGAVFFADAGGAYSTNNLIINPNGGTIMGASGNITVSTNNQSVGLFYNGSTWRTYNAG